MRDDDCVGDEREVAGETGDRLWAIWMVAAARERNEEYNAAHAPLYTTPEFNLTVTALLMISPKNPLGSLPSPCCGAPPFSIASQCLYLLSCPSGIFPVISAFNRNIVVVVESKWWG